MGLGAMLFPEGLRKLRVVNDEVWGSPRVKRRQRDLLRLRGAVRPSAGLGKILLVVALGEVEELVVVGGGGDLSGDLAVDAARLERRLVCVAAPFDQLLLLLVEVVEPTSVLGATVVAWPIPTVGSWASQNQRRMSTNEIRSGS